MTDRDFNTRCDRLESELDSLLSPEELARIRASEALPLVHARSMVFVGFSGGDSCWSGRRTYQERRLPNGQVELVCGAGLDDVHRAAQGTENRFPWATLKSKRSRDAKFVTCPECARRIRAAGFAHAPQETK